MADRVVTDESSERGVINYQTLIDLALEQAPRGEAGRIFREGNVNLEETESMRMEFLNILRIENLWPMKNISKLILAHNLIEKIEKLDELVQLTELDLSFNKIQIMENLDHLVNLEILVLTGNQISEIHHIDGLINLQIFSIAENKIETWDHVMYLRKFETLRSFNIEGNPCTQVEGYRNYLLAFLPQVVYFFYRMISDDERQQAVEVHRLAISKIEDHEASLRRSLIETRSREEKLKKDSASYVDNLDGDVFFLEMYELDNEGTALTKINRETQTIFEDYKKNFMDICQELYEFGMKEHEKREKEIETFQRIVGNAQKSVRDEARRIMDNVTLHQDSLIERLKSYSLEKSSKNQIENPQKSVTEMSLDDAPKIVEDFEKILSSTWTKLMYSEVVLHEQMEDVTDSFKINLSDMMDSFAEFTRATFSRLRNADIDYRDEINRIVGLWVSNTFSEELAIPKDIQELCGDSETLSNNLGASHDLHLQTIDAKEDLMIRGINSWCEGLVEKFIKKEHERHRGKILEISHFLEYERGKLDKILQKYHLNFDKAMEADLAAIFDE